MQGATADAEQLRALTHFYVDAFNYLMPLGGLVSVPISGWVMVHLGLTAAFALIGVMCSALTLLQVLGPNIPLTVQVRGMVWALNPKP